MSKQVNVDFVTRQIKVDTDGKEYFISAAMAAKDAEASMLNAQNAANTAEKIATDLGLVDEAVQTAVASATTASNKANIATTKADVATTKASEANLAATTATTKAEAASMSATNAAQSYANADAVATQLTEYLATKETLTAPAVDKTLLIEGAAADSKVAGELIGELKGSLENKLTYHPCNIVEPNLVDGYVRYANGTFSTYSGDGKFKRTDLIQVPPFTKIIQMPYEFNGEGGYAFYDRYGKYISGNITKYAKFIIDGYYGSIPPNAQFVAFTYYDSTAQHTKNYVRFYQRHFTPITIDCLGDSITEGMGMSSQRYVELNGDNYPSHLQTLFKNGGSDAFVNNYGSSGEKTDAVLARLGGIGALYFSENVVINANNDVIDVTNKVYSSLTNEKVTFTSADYRMSFASCNGVNIRFQLESGKLYVNLATARNEQTILLANAPIILGGYFYNKASDFAIVYMGINDGSSLTFEEWINRINIVREHFGKNRVFVIGTTNAQWNIYTDIKDLPNPVLTYNKRCLDEFGNYFINLYPIMCRQEGINIAMDGGYLLNRTSAEIEADNTAVNAWQTPPSLTVDGTQGNVHFNNVGYYVMAKIIYDRMVNMNIV